MKFLDSRYGLLKKSGGFWWNDECDVRSGSNWDGSLRGSVLITLYYVFVGSKDRGVLCPRQRISKEYSASRLVSVATEKTDGREGSE